MAFVRTIDRLSEGVGKLAAWLGLAMVLIAAANAVLGALDPYTEARLGFVALDEAEWYLFSVLFLFAAPWGLKEGSHVRVDVLYGRLGARGRAWTDLLGGLLLAVPFALYATWVTAPVALESFRLREVSNDAGGLLRYPLMAAVPVAFALVALQAVANAVRAWSTLSGAGRADGETQR